MNKMTEETMGLEKMEINETSSVETSSVETSSVETSSVKTYGKYIGFVKWFNKKKGFGFITCINDGEDRDIFFHYSSIISTSFKVLYPGEYVSFDTSVKVDKVTCNNITGIMGRLTLAENEDSHYKVMPKRKFNSVGQN
jgi:CspA family cold shock protein